MIAENVNRDRFHSLESDGKSQAAAKLYREQGVIVVRQVFGKDEIGQIRQAFTDHVEANEKQVWVVDGTPIDTQIADDDILKKYPRYIMPHRHPDMLPGQLARKYLTDGRILDIAENLMGGKSLAAQSMFYFKPPTARGQALHQDNYFLQTYPETCMAAWIAIDDADAENGGLEVVPGTHYHDLVCPEDADPAVSFSTRVLRLPPGYERVQSEIEAGDVLFFHGSLVHGSMPNTSDDRFRRALIFHYVPATSQKVAKMYQPLLTRDGEEVRVTESIAGGECGQAWAIAGA